MMVKLVIVVKLIRCSVMAKISHVVRRPSSTMSPVLAVLTAGSTGVAGGVYLLHVHVWEGRGGSLEGCCFGHVIGAAQ